jgi:hypothetical protein
MWLAEQILPSLTGNRTDRDALAKEAKGLLTRAQATDAMEQPTKYPPSGTWVRSRLRQAGAAGLGGPRQDAAG